MHAICEFKIAEAVPLSGSITYEDLAVEVQRLSGTAILPLDLRRLLRLAITNNTFHEPKIGSVAHNRISLLLLDDTALANWAAFFTMDMMGPVANTVAAMKKWPGSQEANETVGRKTASKVNTC